MTEGSTIDDLASGIEEPVAVEAEVEEGGKFPPFSIPAWFRSETGEGAIEDYLEHPMNFNKSRSVAQILRGLTGVFGSLKLAVIDIVLGGLEFARERKGPPVN